MRAWIRLANGERKFAVITRIEADGECRYGIAKTGLGGKEVPVSETTTIHHADGRVTKEWDEVIGSTAGFEFVTDKEDEYW